MQRSLALTALALAVAILVSHAGIVLGDDTWDDVRYHTEIAPPRLAAGTEIVRGDVPAWWDGAGFGVPLLGDPGHGALAVTTWPARTGRAFDALLVLHLWWAALGVAAWARRRGASELAGLGAGLLVATSGVFASAAIRGALPALAMLPWVGVGAAALGEASDRASRAWAALGVAAALGAIALAGQLALLGDALVIALAVGGARAAWPWLGAALAAGLAIGCAQWIPAALQLPHEVGAQVGALPLARLVELVAPGRFAAAGAWFPSLYAGAALLALARLGRRDVVVIAVLGAAALIAGRGGWPAWSGAPELHVAAAVCVIAASAASGLDGALAGNARAARALAIGAVVTTCAAIAAARAHPDSEAARDGAVSAVCLALAALLAWRARGAWKAPVVLALVLAPSIAALQDVAPTTSRAPIEAPSAWATAALAATPPRGGAPVRVFRPSPFALAGSGTGGPVTVLGLDDAVATLAGESAATWGLAIANTAEPARDPGEDAAWLAAGNEAGALLARFGVGIAMVPTVAASAHHLPPLADRRGISLTSLPVAPLASVAHGWRWAVAPADAFAHLYTQGGGVGIPWGTIVLRGSGDASGDPRDVIACAIDDWHDGEIATRCDAGATPGYAVVTSSPARGWRASVDGDDRDWLVADVMRRAVALPAGAHAVTWSYSAPGWRAGAALAALGLLGMLAMAWAARRAAKQAPKKSVE